MEKFLIILAKGLRKMIDAYIKSHKTKINKSYEKAGKVNVTRNEAINNINRRMEEDRLRLESMREDAVREENKKALVKGASLANKRNKSAKKIAALEGV